MNKLNSQGIELSVTINGKPAKTYLHENCYYLESREDTEYSLTVKNNNPFRVEVVAAVDGLSVLSGKLASKQDVGYIVAAYGDLNIKGFRKDTDSVGAFKFTKKESSYAAEKGGEDNVGIIAIAIYKEKYLAPGLYWNGISGGKFQDWNKYQDWKNNTTTPDIIGSTYGGILRGMSTTTSNTSTTFNAGVVQSSVAPEAQNYVADIQAAHGTGWGSKIDDKVVYTEFTRDTILLNHEIYYNSKENLEAMGIKLIQEKTVHKPKGFPADFASPPKNWKG